MPSVHRVLVTGAAGFIGSHLCRRLVADGIEVVGLDDLSESTADSLRDLPEVRLVEADLRDQQAVLDAARGCTAIFHQGAKRSISRSLEEPELTTAVNLLGTLNALVAARDEGAVLVAASSSSVYGNQTEFPVHEGLTPAPRSPYAASKLAVEAYCGTFFRAHGTRTVALRYFNAYGPGQDPDSEYAAVVPRFTVACLAGTRPELHGDGQQSRDFTYIDDVVDANLLASRANERAWGRAFNVGGGGVPTTVHELLAMIAGRVGVLPDPIYAPLRPGDIRRSMADVSLAGELLGFTPQIEIAEGIGRTVDWFRRLFDADVEERARA